MLYSELKSYFETVELPATLNAKHCYYTDVKRTVDLYISNIELAMSGTDKPNQTAKDYKAKLQDLYDALQAKENWNVKRPEINKFNNRNGI